MKIKYVRENDKLFLISKIHKGDWIDLAISENADISKGDFAILSLGIRMKLPKGFEALLIPRSSTFKKYGIIQANSVGLLDNSYCGREDIWKFAALAFRHSKIPQGTRICQFRIIPSMNASFWTKLRWLFTSKVEFVEEEYLRGEESRGGFGSTG